MALTLYFHPLASFCHKVLIALYENQTPFTGQIVNLADKQESAEFLTYGRSAKYRFFETMIAIGHFRKRPSSSSISRSTTRARTRCCQAMPPNVSRRGCGTGSSTSTFNCRWGRW